MVISKGDTFVPGDSSFIFPFPGAFQYTGHDGLCDVGGFYTMTFDPATVLNYAAERVVTRHCSRSMA